MQEINNENLTKEEKILRIRHSLSHVMAQAVVKMFPGTRLT